MSKTVCVLSGGLDSTTLLHYIKHLNVYDEIYAITYFYGQRHSKEVECAKYQAQIVGVKEHKIIDISFLGQMLKGSALTDVSVKVPGAESIGDPQPSSYTPNRNMILLSIAVGYAEAIGANTVYYGAQKQDIYCFPGYTQVITPHGIKSMKELKEGDLVSSMDYKGDFSWKKVTHKFKSQSSKLLRIWAKSSTAKKSHFYFDVTPGHHIVKADFIRKFDILSDVAPIHGEARDLKIGDHLFTQRQELDTPYFMKDVIDLMEYVSDECKNKSLKEENGYIGLNKKGGSKVKRYMTLKDFSILSAWFATEGCINNQKGLIICQDPKSLYFNEIKELFEHNGLTPNEQKYGWMTWNPVLYDVITKNCGIIENKSSSFTKKLPNFILEYPNNILNETLLTLIKGDGSFSIKGVYQFYTTSNDLLNQILYICTRLGYFTSVRQQTRGANKNKIWCVYINLGKKRPMFTWRGARLVSIEKIEELPEYEDLYDITVEENHTVTAGTNGFFVLGQSYFDATTEFVNRLNSVLDLNRKNKITIETPFVNMKKTEVLEIGRSLDIDYSNTWTCYSGEEKACGKCLTCLERLKSFQNLNLKDPLEYA